jgi:uncharacterized protein YoxC
MTKAVSIATSVLVLSLAVSAFVLSYDALHGLAADNGVKANLAPIFPFVVDGFLVVASLSVLRNSLLGERALYQWGLVILFTGASIAFNIIHAPSNWLARSIGAMPPVALALAFELLMGQIKSEVNRGQAVKTLETLTENVSEKRRALDELTAKRQQLTQTVNELSEQIDEKRQRLDALMSTSDAVKTDECVSLGNLTVANLTRDAEAQEAIDALLNFYADNPNASQSEAAKAADRSRSWVSMRLSELEEAGTVKRNGDGVEVLIDNN